MGFGLLCHGAAVPPQVHNGFVSGRSADAIIMPSELSDDASITLLGEDISLENVPKSIALRDVRDIMSQSLGLPVSQEKSFIREDVFDRPSLEYLIIVHGMGADTVSQLDLANMKALTSKNPTMGLRDQTYPRDPLALSVTLTTGQYPSVHGIVGESWRADGQMEAAYSNGKHSDVGNVADMMTQFFGTKSLTVSASGSLAESKAHAPHSKSANSHACSFNTELKKFVSESRSPSFEWSLEAKVDADELWNLIKLAGGRVEIQEDRNLLVVQAHSSASTINFDLNDSVDSTLAAEILYAKVLAEKLSANELLQDDTPDSIFLSFRGLEAIAGKYGRKSEQYNAAAQLYDSAIPVIASLYSKLASKSVGQLVLMGSPVTLDKEILMAQIKHLSLSLDTRFFPSIYFSESDSNPAQTCQVLETGLGTSVKTVCSHPLYDYDETVFLASHSSSTNSTVTEVELKKFQIVLWLSLALAFSLLAGICSFCCMEYERDTLLFSKRRLKEPSAQ
eukprot:CAMPEP_0184483318 /NCGR_PEP_ID=MMETSP0113_2-20130426/4960_1 /TAXON_ID=91329 /ORGANISM="Norrisiella sphaerica, Strain BC52" /LENGTH=506 /DNA_ID=CAMNT_0026863639 /DNA_START=21 /DNA_END=1541 /DNA_ORIENTATION=-